MADGMLTFEIGVEDAAHEVVKLMQLGLSRNRGENFREAISTARASALATIRDCDALARERGNNATLDARRAYHRGIVNGLKFVVLTPTGVARK